MFRSPRVAQTPIGAAVDGLATVLLWPASMTIEPPADDGDEPIFLPS